MDPTSETDRGSRYEENSKREKPKVKKLLRKLSAWSTDLVSIDYTTSCPESSSYKASFRNLCRYPHTIIMFVPGNPGCVNWYVKMLTSIVERLGVGYAARGISYAGHGLGKDIIGTGIADHGSRGKKMTVVNSKNSKLPERNITCEQEAMKDCDNMNELRDTSIAWTVDGQIRHKIDWVDLINHEMKSLGRIWRESSGSHYDKSGDNKSSLPLPRLIFLTHSIGAHLVQRLCVLRADLLSQTLGIVHLMPFFRFDPPQPTKEYLSILSRSPDAISFLLQSMSRLASTLPPDCLDAYLKKAVGVLDDEGRKLARELMCQPAFTRNFFELGSEEIREVPEEYDIAGLKIISKHCRTSLLFCGGPDQWAPYLHMKGLSEMVQKGLIPQKRVEMKYIDSLVHDFVVHPEMLPPAIDFVVKAVEKNMEEVLFKKELTITNSRL